jgi:SMC interacting uncharacterized protein involved in chromosome segregation
MDHDKFITTLSLENLQQHARDQHLFEEYMCNEVNKKDAELAALRAELEQARADLEMQRIDREDAQDDADVGPPSRPTFTRPG